VTAKEIFSESQKYARRTKSRWQGEVKEGLPGEGTEAHLAVEKVAPSLCVLYRILPEYVITYYVLLWGWCSNATGSGVHILRV
jgi:hypothetical protein